MKKLTLLLLFCFSISCSEDTVNNNNPNLPNYTFSYNIETNLPSFEILKLAGNGVYIGQSGIGVRGVFVFNTGSGYTAWDAACPNQPLAACSTMTLNGIDAKCPCDNKLYSLFTGQSPGEKFPMKQYRTEVNGTQIRVFN